MCFRQCNIQFEIEDVENPGKYGGSTLNRKYTDVPAIVIMAASVIIMISFSVYYIANGDLDIIINGYDDCGNICGKNNLESNSVPFECFGKNMEHKKYLMHRIIEGKFSKECVENCPVGWLFWNNRCYLNMYAMFAMGFSITEIIFHEFIIYWKTGILLLIIVLVMSIILLLMYRFYNTFIIVFSLITFILICIFITIYFWYIYETFELPNKLSVLIMAIFLTIITGILIIILFLMKRKVKLIKQIFQEAVNVMDAMPLLIVPPIITSILSIIGYIYMINCGLRTACVCNLEKFPSDNTHVEYVDYVLSIGTKLIVCYNCIVNLWIIQFFYDCQCMIVGGCVAIWFFNSNKDNISRPIRTTVFNLIKYHLGTVAFGSIVIIFMELMGTIVQKLKSFGESKQSMLSCFCYIFSEHCLAGIIIFLNFFSKNAYVETALYGYGFCNGTIRSFKLLLLNMYNVLKINTIGDLVLLSSKLMVTTISLIIGAVIFNYYENLTNYLIPLSIIGVCMYTIVHIFVSVFEVAVDTIFLCFCEDFQINDGMSKPYYMSPNLMEFIKTSNKYINPVRLNSIVEEI